MALKRIRIIKEYLATSNNAAGRFHDFYVDKRSMYIQRAAETYIGICRGGTTKICMLNLPKSFIWILRGATAVSRLKAHAGFVSMCLLIFRYSLNYRKIEPFIFLGYDSRGEPFFLFFFFRYSLSLSLPPSPLSLSRTQRSSSIWRDFYRSSSLHFAFEESTLSFRRPNSFRSVNSFSY